MKKYRRFVKIIFIVFVIFLSFSHAVLADEIAEEETVSEYPRAAAGISALGGRRAQLHGNNGKL